MFYEGLRLREAHLHVFYVSGRLSGGRPSNQAVNLGWSAKENPSRAWGEGEGEGGAGIIMSSNDVGSYEFKRSSCEMQMEECSANLARPTSDGSADFSIAPRAPPGLFELKVCGWNCWTCRR